MPWILDAGFANAGGLAEGRSTGIRKLRITSEQKLHPNTKKPFLCSTQAVASWKNETQSI